MFLTCTKLSPLLMPGGNTNRFMTLCLTVNSIVLNAVKNINGKQNRGYKI